MKFSLRHLLLEAFGYWNCPIAEEERNLFRVEIEAGSVAESVCEASGTVHIGVVEFEEDVVAPFDVWRSFTPGSYYLHRLLERLSEGPVTGRARATARYPAPAAEDVLSLRQFLSADCRFDGEPERQELSVNATTFHFAVSLLGVEPRTELIGITVEPLRKNVLPEASLFYNASPKWVLKKLRKDGTPELFLFDPGEVIPPGALKTEEVFPAAARELKERLAGLLEDYKKKRSGVTAEAVRKIRAAKRADLVSLPEPGGDPELIRRRAEVEEIWTIREQDARIRGEAERVDISLVAATIQERPMALYRVGLTLPDGRRRRLERLYDRAAGWVEPLRCEVCLRQVDAYTHGEGPCSHLMCGECAYRDGGCAHAMCQECAPRCNRCRERSCPLCLTPCVGCGKIACPSHRSTCSDCRRSICNTCSPPCPDCAKRSCPIHGIRCPTCGQVLCSVHRKHKKEMGMFRFPYELAKELSLTEAWIAKLDGRAFRGRKAFLDAVSEALGEVAFNKVKSYVVRRAEKCYEIWYESALMELIDYAVDFSDPETAFSPDNWRFPFELRPEHKQVVWHSRNTEPEVVTSLEDVGWWLSQSRYGADPFLNEYGFLPDEAHETGPFMGEDGFLPDELQQASLDGIEPERVLRLGWFEHDRDSDPTQDTIPFYDPGSLDTLAEVLDEADERYLATRGRASPRYR